LAGFGRLWPALAGFGRLWPALAGFGRLWPITTFNKPSPQQACCRWGRI